MAWHVPAAGLDGWRLYIDEVNFEAIPSCLAPTGLMTSNITNISADLTFTDAAASGTANIEYGVAGFTQGTGTVITGTTNTTENITGLTADTEYEFYVQSDCGGGDLSLWVGPYTFLTGYCTPSSTSALTYIDNFSTSNGSSNISNLSSGFTAGGYFDGTTQSVESYASGTFDFNAEIVGGTVGFAIWIDWNNDLVFDDATEKVFNTTSYGSGPFTGTITVPALTALGNYSMRTNAHYNASNPSDPCNTASRAEFEDYTITIIPPVLVTSITVQGQGGVSTITTNAGTLQMEATVLPANASDATYTWSVTNGTGAATIDAAGLLTASADGDVTVTATANDASGITGTAVITLSNQNILVTSITVQGQGGITTVSLDDGTLQMEAIVLPANASDGTYTWSIVNGTGQATIDAAGLLTATHNGDVTVTATANDASGITGTTIITITNQTAVGVNENGTIEISIYPNPTQDFVTIVTTATIKTINVDGKLVLTDNAENNILNIKDLANGSYIIVINTTDGLNHKSRIVKQ